PALRGDLAHRPAHGVVANDHSAVWAPCGSLQLARGLMPDQVQLLDVVAAAAGQQPQQAEPEQSPTVRQGTHEPGPFWASPPGSMRRIAFSGKGNPRASCP